MKKILFVLFLLPNICLSAGVKIYWVDSGFDDFFTNNLGGNWSFTSGGSSCFCIPSLGDTAIFDSNSGNHTITIDESPTISSLISWGSEVTLINASSNMNIDAEFIIGDSVTWVGNGAEIYFDLVNGNGNIYCSSVLNEGVLIGYSGTYELTLLSDLDLGSGNLIVDVGIINFAGYDVTANSYTLRQNFGTIYYGSGIFTLTGSDATAHSSSLFHIVDQGASAQNSGAETTVFSHNGGATCTFNTDDTNFGYPAIYHKFYMSDPSQGDLVFKGFPLVSVYFDSIAINPIGSPTTISIINSGILAFDTCSISGMGAQNIIKAVSGQAMFSCYNANGFCADYLKIINVTADVSITRKYYAGYHSENGGGAGNWIFTNCGARCIEGYMQKSSLTPIIN